MCYETLLSINDCGNKQTVTEDTIYLDVLTGIDSNELDQIFTGNYKTGLELFIDKRKSAWQIMSADVVNKLGSGIKAESITNNNTIGHVAAGIVTDALGAGNWVGIKVEVDNPKSFLDLFFSNLSLLLPGVVAGTPVKIFDLDTGLPLINFVQIANVRTFINKRYANPRGKRSFAIVYESTVTATRTVLRDGYSCGSCTSGKLLGFDPYVSASGVKLTLDVNGNVATQTNAAYTYGMVLDYSLSCSNSDFLCSIANRLSLPFGYLTAAQIMDYSVNIAPHKRVNNTVKYSLENNEKRLQIYAAAYNEQVSNILSNMRMPNDPVCFYCEKRIIINEFAI